MTNARRIMVCAGGCLAMLTSVPRGESATTASVEWQRNEEYYPQTDFAIYRDALTVRDANVRANVIGALSKYAEGYDVIMDYVRQHGDDHDRLHAISSLKVYSEFPDYERRLLSLQAQLHEVPDRERNTRISGALAEIDRQLFAVNPKRYATNMFFTVRAHLEERGSNISFSYRFDEKITALARHLDRAALYALVPVLADRLKDGFFSDTPKRALTSLKIVTGQAFPCDTRSRKSRNTAAERYRELYYTKLLPEIPEEFRKR